MYYKPCCQLDKHYLFFYTLRVLWYKRKLVRFSSTISLDLRYLKDFERQSELSKSPRATDLAHLIISSGKHQLNSIPRTNLSFIFSPPDRACSSYSIFDKINLVFCRLSSVVEQHFCKVKVIGPNPIVGSKD